jgi:hypothetical protein
LPLDENAANDLVSKTNLKSKTAKKKQNSGASSSDIDLKKPKMVWSAKLVEKLNVISSNYKAQWE